VGLAADLGRVLSPDRVLSRPIDRLARSVDASIYRLIPEVVVRPRDVEEVRALLAFCRARKRHLTFRTAGTSLSGQALSDDILVELGPLWRESRVLDGGRRVWVQPGVVGGYVNLRLAAHGYRLGPDPASIDAAMMGGIVANNSSGMCCGVAQNSYHTLESAVVVLADGAIVDTSRPGADERLRGDRPGLHAGLVALRDEIRGDAALAARIRNRFARKNTTAYSLNAFLDHDAPAEILARLMVGSQGTLGFLAEMTLRTVPDPPARATALLFFHELHDAGAAVAPLAAAGAAALEIMDAASLRSQADERGYAFPIGDGTAALLVEFREADDAAVDAAVARAVAALGTVRLLAPASFTRDRAERERHWMLRKGLFPSVGGMRPSGTAVVIEDVVFPVERLAEAIVDLRALFDRHGFSDAILFGHARDGNLHFVFARDFADPPTVARYAAFMRGLVDLVVGKYDGALKAEHGSGRNMAPFVRDEWGDRAYGVMRRVKDLLDPDGILNPGTILSDDPEIHLKDLKPLPPISPLADRCIECGFCEPRCPSRDLTLTPRQRIVVHRELVRLRALDTAESREWADSLRADFDYEGIATCSVDSMCSTSCPVKIDTGALIKETRAASQPAAGARIARMLARHFGLTARAARAGLRFASLARRTRAGRHLLSGATRPLHRALPSVIPWLRNETHLPRAADPLPPAKRASSGASTSRVVYFPSCLTRILGPLPGEDVLPTAEAMVDVLAMAGFEVVYPPGIDALCCGMPFSSKAFLPAARVAARRTGDALWAASREGADPVVTDASPCAGALADLAVAGLREEGKQVEVYDFPRFWAEHALARVGENRRRPGAAVLHPTCTLMKSGGLPDLLRVARAHSDTVILPPAAECCGFAGDRGFLVPELTAAATAREARDVLEITATRDAGLYSTCRTCEIGMSRAVGRPYRSLVHLVHEALAGA
jgi:D-lactate dehydrogenase